MTKRLICWLYGHRDLRIRHSSLVSGVTAYRCAYCGKIWSERDRPQVTL